MGLLLSLTLTPVEVGANQTPPLDVTIQYCRLTSLWRSPCSALNISLVGRPLGRQGNLNKHTAYFIPAHFFARLHWQKIKNPTKINE
tara:strand:- start:918 stop:1178 length:261 start_codon:yes stop_codon:yes gene_type:complete